ncbi:MAG: hypothetical protein RMN52_16815 [Anaerolineae bacterium]|nr:hypothetical protein [Candidatus Roseilinea sp.]MDW8451659.1 hypothetical protein [Anaerolineae bacterium]
MKKRTWFKASLGMGAVALIASAGLAFASPASALVPAISPQASAQHWGGVGIGRGAKLATIAQALNMTEAELRAELQAGKSVADVASAKGVALDTIVNAVIAEQTTALNEAVAAGRITQAQADAILANLRIVLPAQLQVRPVAGLNDRGFGFGFGGRGRGHKGGFGIHAGASLNTIATSLNMTVAELVTELQSGKSVADVAAAKGIALDTVINAIVNEQTTRLNAAVAAGRITQEQAGAAIANLQENLPELLALKGGPFGFGFGRWPGKWPVPSATPQPTDTNTSL